MRHLFTARTFFVLSGLFIFYATTIPWDMAHGPTLANVAWIPGWDTERNRLWSVPDMVQNVVLFMPFGFFGYLGLPKIRARGPVMGSALMALLGLSLSLLVESLQTMSATRSPSATDLATNLAGAGVGATIAAVYTARLAAPVEAALAQTVRERPGLLVLGAYFAAITLGSLAPFIPTLDIGLLRASVRAFLDDPWGPKPVGALVTDALLFGALAFVAVHELPGWLRRQRWWPLPSAQPLSAPLAAALVVAVCGSWALLLEAAQLLIRGHSPGVQDAVFGFLGAAVGAAIAAVLAKGPPRPAARLGALTRRSPWVVVGFAVLAPFCRALQPFQFGSIGEGLAEISGWNLVPFWALFRNLNLSTFRNVFEAAAIYLPLGYALAALGRPPKIGFLACLGLALVLEVLQIPVLGRVFDITEGLYAGLMGLAGAWALGSLEAYRDPKRRAV